MAYKKTTWVNNQTKLNATNMNKIENGIETNSNNMPNGINKDNNNYLILEHDGTEVAGQKKQVKVFSSEDQAKLEKIAGESEFSYDTLPYRLVTSLEIVNERGFGILQSDGEFWLSNESNDITIGCNNDGELIITQGNDKHHLPYPDTQEGEREDIIDEIVTSSNLKTLFGNQSIYGSGNIDLYVHYLKITTQTNEIWYGTLYSSNKFNASGAGQGLTTLLKPPANEEREYIIMVLLHPDVGVLIWDGSTWGIKYGGGSYTITNIEDRVEPM